MKTFIVIGSMLVGSLVYGEELNVKITCKAGKCVPVVPPAKVVFGGDTTNLNVRLARLQKKVANLEVTTQQELSALKKETVLLNQQIRDLLSKLNDKATREELLALSRKLDSIVEDLRKTQEHILTGLVDHHKRLLALERTRNHLLLGGFGGVATTYMGTGGLDLTVQLPLGEGKWSLNLSGGLGVSPSEQVGSLLSIVVARRLNRHLSLGPAALHLMDWGNTLNTGKNMVAGGGAEVTWHVNNVISLSVLPFLGVGVGTTNTYTNHPAVWSDSACGQVLVKPSYTEKVETKHAPVFTGGLVARLRFQVL